MWRLSICLPRARERDSADAHVSKANRMNGANDPSDPQEPTQEVYHDDWSTEQIEQLFLDLAAGAEVEHVQLKRTGPVEPLSLDSIGDQRVTLQEASDAFQRGDASAIQIRYRFEGQVWCDTLLVREADVRIVRTPLPPWLANPPLS